ncbi:MAG: HlyC/CorC family transporter [Lachnospiraceae bacterium]|nr:HlyC/CorC family transporter [Lachnospiraceae bacterium]MBR7076933.1 HlyC/CorC family transporter [Lachnospiraceae bacterium]
MEDNPRAGFFGKLFKKKDENEFENEIVSMLNEGQEQGEILESEAEMITNIFDLDETNSSEIMTHRKNIRAIDGDATLEEAMEFILDEPFSRFPVYQESIDNIIGILHIKDAIKYYVKENVRDRAVKEIEGLLQKAYFIPETSKINSIFKNMQSQKTHMEIVVDEYGQTSGIICMEDILEEIVGNIFDEHDEVEVNITKISDQVYHVKGLTPLSELEEELGISFEDEDFETLNGYLISKIDRIPDQDAGTIIKENGVTYQILAVDDKTISLVKITMDKPEESVAEL